MQFPKYSMDDFITGDKFRAVCDIDAEKDPRWEQNISARSDRVYTLFTQTHEMTRRIPIITGYTNKKFIVVSHNSDGEVGYWDARRAFDYKWKQEPNILHWFAQNCEVAESNVTPIPIALENEYVFKKEVKQRLMVELRNSNIEKLPQIFLCFNIRTNRDDRGAAWKKFEGVPWATRQEGFNNINLVRPYFEQMARHKYVLCPDGNGIDTIRIWEALYMGCIPVVKRHAFTEFYEKHLPMIICDCYDVITLGWLEEKAAAMEGRQFDWDMLKISYWDNKIRSLKTRFLQEVAE